MKIKVLFLLGTILMCAPVLAGLKLEAGNHTDLKDQQINGLVSNLVTAVHTNSQDALLPLLHPDCQKAKENNEDVPLFLKFVLSSKIPVTCKWKATSIKDGSALLAINRFIIKPTHCIDVFWSAPTKKDPDHLECISIPCVLQGDTLFVVTWMNDYLKKTTQPSNNNSDGIRRPADGSPKPSK